MESSVVAPLALFALWWVGWTTLYVQVVKDRRRGTVAVLAAYELSLVALVIAATVLVHLGTVSVTVPDAGRPVLVTLVVGVTAGFASWMVLTGFTGVRRLGPLRPTRRLGVGLGLVWVSATGEEIAFRLLLMSALTVGLDSPWWAWAVTSVAFGLHHLAIGGWQVTLLHSASGAVFGGLVLAGLGISSAIAAHLAYNTCAAVVREREMQAVRGVGAVSRGRWV